MKQRGDDRRIVMQSLAMVMQFGLNMIVPICMMTALGIWLDSKLGTSWITIVLFVVGAIAGAQNIYRMAKSLYGGEERNKEHGNSGENDKKDHTGVKKKE